MIVKHTIAACLYTKDCDNKDAAGLCAGHELVGVPVSGAAPLPGDFFPPSDPPEPPITPKLAYEMYPWCRIALCAIHGQQRTIRSELERQAKESQ